ncbi:hypothetical protein CXG81DRAFT_29220 [Caulochytrium protostelioides]|nr:hypothetical protein CXG81DRAFT_29220 [Caulochytrium protostelioides]|eukprot:RKP03635.1 hypothetical protein CXG81DRAFT_29220 [Caulochytrium protostelioides]
MPSDLLTPVSAFLKLTNGAMDPYSFLFESVEGGENQSRYSFLGSRPIQHLRALPDQDPLRPLEALMAELHYEAVPELPFFLGGAVGYLSYDCVRFFEPRVGAAQTQLKDTLGLADSFFMICDAVVVFDHVFQQLYVVDHYDSQRGAANSPEAEYARVRDSIYRRVEQLFSPEQPLPVQPRCTTIHPGTSNVGREGYVQFVRDLKHYITEGDIIQAVPSQRIVKPTQLHPFNAYRALRRKNPSPYMFYMAGDDYQIVGASPEALVKVEQGKVTTHPIAGTRRRGKTPAEDQALEEELLADPKERSEHIMLVDLGRNDINRICQPATVKVDSLMHIERYSHVMHIVSHVSGQLRPECTAFDAVRSIFPAGTVSGAPKVRAMELIYQLEKEKRGIYAGAVGYFSYTGDVDTCIAIRTMLFKDGNVYLQAGGGIVHDSVEEDEYIETINKLGSNVAALDEAERSFA